VDPWDAYLKFMPDGTLQIMNRDLYERLDHAIWDIRGRDRKFSIWWQETRSHDEGGTGNKVNVMCPC
jgi:hypothetical protein